MPLKLVTPPSLVPVTLAEAKLHLRVDVTDDDALISSLVLAATADAEHHMGRAILPQQWCLTLESFFDPAMYNPPAPITIDLIRGPTYSTGATALLLSRPTVTAVVSVQYVDAAGTLQTMPSANYQLANASDYSARIVPAYGQSWPATRAQPEAVQVLFSCGYPDVASVPELIKAWIKLRVSALYENRQAWTLGKAIEQNPFIDRLLDRYCVLAC